MMKSCAPTGPEGQCETAAMRRPKRRSPCSGIATLAATITVTVHACVSLPPPPATTHAAGAPATVAQEIVLQTFVAPRPDEDLATTCGYELRLLNSPRTVKGVWVIFERSLDMLRYYRDADVRAFARRHDLALLFPFHCASKSETVRD